MNIQQGILLKAAQPRPCFPEVFREHLQGVRALVRYFGVAERHVEDVTQEVLLKVFLALDRVDGTRPLKPWLMTITYRTVLDHLWLAFHREGLTDTGSIDGPSVTPTPEQDVAMLEDRALLDELLAGCDVVLRLAELDELPHAAIAAALGVPPSTVQSRLRRARAELALRARRYLARQKGPRAFRCDPPEPGGALGSAEQGQRNRASSRNATRGQR